MFYFAFKLQLPSLAAPSPCCTPHHGSGGGLSVHQDVRNSFPTASSSAAQAEMQLSDRASRAEVHLGHSTPRLALPQTRTQHQKSSNVNSISVRGGLIHNSPKLPRRLGGGGRSHGLRYINQRM